MRSLWLASFLDNLPALSAASDLVNHQEVILPFLLLGSTLRQTGLFKKEKGEGSMESVLDSEATQLFPRARQVSI